ncbi:hypothetical protein IE81DRAFT_15018 [Ceraceosorus guamensis]|uniref:F-box domain-containing protein n=1 Tax=Ceraceosorus guamensis TaxID=1522189 RepID=A0A316VT81_9BASI|nr:hypothetical protein IE81DRAFT_15018 [Ceraceosorus guamensis]PWN39623.1 hypothetical protein IE81DRAFT_15018 [Ceraceosorus guamensis]
MQTLPVEIFPQIMVHADPRAVYLGRRVCMLWKRLIDADEDIWSSVAYQWRLVSSANSQLPPFISEAARSPADDCSQPHQIWGAPRLPYSYYRARTHFHGVDSFKNLCSVHVSLTENWEEASDFLIHTCLQEEVGTLPPPPSESIRRVRGKSSSLYELMEVDDVQNVPFVCAVETWKWEGGRKKMINRVRLPGRKHRADCLCIRFPYCVTFMRATRNRPQLIYWDILSPSDPVVLEATLSFPSYIFKLDFDLEAQIVIATSGNDTLVQSLRDGSVLSYVMERPSAGLSEWEGDGTGGPTACYFDMILGSLDIAVGTIYLDPGSHTRKRGPLVPTIIEWETMPRQKANANSDSGKRGSFNLWTFKDRLERCQRVGTLLNDHDPEPMHVSVDRETDTLIVMLPGGFILIRSYSLMHDPSCWHQMRLALVRYFGLESPTLAGRVHLNRNRAVSDIRGGRMSFSAPLGAFGDKEAYTCEILVDLKPHRLDTAYQYQSCPFRCIKAWQRWQGW